jgi:hypothetical protein
VLGAYLTATLWAGRSAGALLIVIDAILVGTGFSVVTEVQLVSCFAHSPTFAHVLLSARVLNGVRRG